MTTKIHKKKHHHTNHNENHVTVVIHTEKKKKHKKHKHHTTHQPVQQYENKPYSNQAISSFFSGNGGGFPSSVSGGSIQYVNKGGYDLASQSQAQKPHDEDYYYALFKKRELENGPAVERQQQPTQKLIRDVLPAVERQQQPTIWYDVPTDYITPVEAAPSEQSKVTVLPQKK
jgi:hypothetical protein